MNTTQSSTSTPSPTSSTDQDGKNRNDFENWPVTSSLQIAVTGPAGWARWCSGLWRGSWRGWWPSWWSVWPARPPWSVSVRSVLLVLLCCCCCVRVRKKKRLKKKLDSRQTFPNRSGRSRTKTNGTLGRLNNALEDDDSETIIAYRVEEGQSRRRERKADPVYYISNDLRLEKFQAQNNSNNDPPSSLPSRKQSMKG